MDDSSHFVDGDQIAAEFHHSFNNGNPIILNGVHQRSVSARLITKIKSKEI